MAIKLVTACGIYVIFVSVSAFVAPQEILQLSFQQAINESEEKRKLQKETDLKVFLFCF